VLRFPAWTTTSLRAAFSRHAGTLPLLTYTLEISLGALKGQEFSAAWVKERVRAGAVASAWVAMAGEDSGLTEEIAKP
jgi:hypothetical protein